MKSHQDITKKRLSKLRQNLSMNIGYRNMSLCNVGGWGGGSFLAPEFHMKVIGKI